MIHYNQPIFVILFPTGILIGLIGLYVLRNPPKKINKIYGYRTPKAMKSQAAWDFAQIQGTKNMIKGALFMCIAGIIALFFETSEIVGVFIGMCLLLVGTLLPLWFTEKELTKKF